MRALYDHAIFENRSLKIDWRLM